MSGGDVLEAEGLTFLEGREGGGQGSGAGVVDLVAAVDGRERGQGGVTLRAMRRACGLY